MGPTQLGQPHTMLAGLVVLLSQKIPPVQPRNTEGSTQEKCEYNAQACGLSFMKRKKNKEGNFSELFVILIVQRARTHGTNCLSNMNSFTIFNGK